MLEKVSILTRCGNRLEHAKYTLPRMLAQDYANLEVVLVDYNSTDDLVPFLWDNYMPEIESGKLKVVTYDQGGVFHHAHAWNLAIGAATGDLLFFLDIDVLVNSRLVPIVAARFKGQKQMFARPCDDVHVDVCGFLVARKEDVFAVRGYNEQLHGWGFEDGDMIKRLTLLGCDTLRLNMHGMLRPIEHAEDKRLSNVARLADHRMINRDINASRSLFLSLHYGHLANVGTTYGINGKYSTGGTK